MTKSANSGNRELTDYILRALCEVPDGETIDMIEADNVLDPIEMHGGGYGSIERGTMVVDIVTLHLRDGIVIRRTYEMLHDGLRLVRDEPE